MNIIERIAAPTPVFFIKLRNINLLLATLAALVPASPIALPTVVLKIAGYIAVAGVVGSVVSQMVTEKEEATQEEDYRGTAFAKQ